MSSGRSLKAGKRLSIIEGATMIALNGGIMELAKKLVIPGGLPESAAPDAVHSSCRDLSDRLFADLEYPPYRERADPQDY
jgi:hypothetical protein